MLVKWNPFDELIKFDRDFNKLFNYSFSPAMDVYEDVEKISVEAEVPGMGPENIDITLDKNILTIKGQRTINNSKREYLRAERTSGSFVRSFTLPSSIEPEKIQAAYNNGILTIHIPKKPEVVPKKIEIKSTS